MFHFQNGSIVWDFSAILSQIVPLCAYFLAGAVILFIMLKGQKIILGFLRRKEEKMYLDYYRKNKYTPLSAEEKQARRLRRAKAFYYSKQFGLSRYAGKGSYNRRSKF